MARRIESWEGTGDDYSEKPIRPETVAIGRAHCSPRADARDTRRTTRPGACIGTGGRVATHAILPRGRASRRFATSTSPASMPRPLAHESVLVSNDYRELLGCGYRRGVDRALRPLARADTVDATPARRVRREAAHARPVGRSRDHRGPEQEWENRPGGHATAQHAPSPEGQGIDRARRIGRWPRSTWNRAGPPDAGAAAG